VIASEFTTADSERWDELVARAPMATFLHTRRFLSYHEDRMEDASLLLADERGALRAVLPAAADPGDSGRVVSHPGATFGGLVHDGRLYAEGVREALEAALAHYAARGHTGVRYKPVPHIYHEAPSADDVWALSALGAVRSGCALSCAVDLDARREPSTRRARSLRKAREAGVVAADSDLATFWPVLEEALLRRHGERPVHTLAEIELLQARFPHAIRTVISSLDGDVLAGIVLFVSSRVFHVQYMASSEAGMRIAALEPVVEHCIELARGEGARYFDFGTSMLRRGGELQSGLHRFKAEFGGGGVLYETYDLSLGGPAG
jgi:hypothetical protein